MKFLFDLSLCSTSYKLRAHAVRESEREEKGEREEGEGYNLREGGRVSLAQLNEERTIADWDLRRRWQLEKQPKQHLHINTHTHTHASKHF